MSKSTNQQLRTSPELDSRATCLLNRSTTSTNRLSSTSANSCPGSSKAAIPRVTFPSSLLSLFITFLTYLTIFSTASAAPIPGPNPHPLACSGTLDLTPPLFPNTTIPRTTQTSTQTRYVTFTQHPRVPTPSIQHNRGNANRPYQTPVPSVPEHTPVQHGQGRQIVLDASNQPGVGKEGSAQSGDRQGSQTEIPAARKERLEKEEEARAPSYQAGRLELKRSVDEDKEMLAELARRGFGIQDVAGGVDIAKLIETVMAGKPSKRSFKKKAQRRPSRAQSSAPPIPTPSGKGSVQMPRGNSGRASQRAQAQMLLSNLLVQKIPGYNWGGMVAMPSGNV